MYKTKQMSYTYNTKDKLYKRISLTTERTSRDSTTVCQITL